MKKVCDLTLKTIVTVETRALVEDTIILNNYILYYEGIRTMENLFDVLHSTDPDAHADEGMWTLEP